MLKMKAYYLLFICLLVVGCKTGNQKLDYSRASLIHFDFNSFHLWDNPPKYIHLTGLIRNTKVIHLKGEPLGEIKKIKDYKDKVYLLIEEKEIAVYDTLGNPISRISAMGRGPNEYTGLYSFFIDQDAKSLNLVSRFDRKMLVYNLSGDTLIKVEKLPKRYFDMIKTENGYMGYVGNVSYPPNPKNVWHLNEKLEEKRGYLDINKGFESYLNSSSINTFSNYGLKVYFRHMFERNIYAIENGQAYKAFTFDFGEYNAPEIKTLQEWDQTSFHKRANYVYDLHRFQETDNFLIGQILFKSQVLLCLYDKTKKKSTVASLSSYREDDPIMFSFGDILGIDSKTIYGIKDAYFINDILNNKSVDPDIVKVVKRIAEEALDGTSLNDELNPFLIIHSLN